ncbi:multidrug DMT transporter permease [Roseomonas sp. USHLN139]|uniref:multidrug DMT transporter permease n=1 Tax=Roseomonas sp. USHLN139 TaxID=3081298 RepID=UPI003B01399F
MDTFLPALMLLSGGAFINTRANVPELRPASEAADLAWRLLSRLAFYLWIGLLLWGAYQRPLLTVLLGFGLSLAFNVLLAARGPKAIWPGLSMLLSALGILLGVWTVLGLEF